MKPLTYKGYAAHVEFDAEDRLFFGRLAGIDDIISFHGETVDKLVKAFEDAVDDYLETSEKIGRAQQRSYSGRLMLRVPPEVHAHAAKWPRLTARVSTPGPPKCWRGRNNQSNSVSPPGPL